MSEICFDFHGKNFVVTGASSGIGKQIAFELLEAGANVLVVARRKELLDEIYADYRNQVTTAKVDVTADNQWEEPLEHFVGKFGKLNGSVSAAGIEGLNPIRSFDVSLARRIIDTNFFGTISLFQMATKTKYSQANASHVWIGSVAAHKEPKGQSMYSASKGALVSSMRVLCKEISNRKQRLNVVSPGWVRTPLTEQVIESTGKEDDFNQSQYLLGTGQPEDISGVVLFLLSDRAGWMTGSEIVVDGGYLTV